MQVPSGFFSLKWLNNFFVRSITIFAALIYFVPSDPTSCPTWSRISKTTTMPFSPPVTCSSASSKLASAVFLYALTTFFPKTVHSPDSINLYFPLHSKNALSPKGMLSCFFVSFRSNALYKLFRVSIWSKLFFILPGLLYSAFFQQ